MAKKAFAAAFGLDVLLLLALGCYFLFNKLAGSPFMRGFFCDDPSISFPYKPNSISWVACLMMGGFIPLSFIVVLELTLANIAGKARTTSLAQSLLLHISPFVAGFFIENMFVEIAKFNLGRLRPNFIAVCHPYFEIEGKGYECSNTTNPNGYVGSYECVNQDYKESLLSFPSGHTSLITYAMVYCAGYLQLRMPRIPISFLIKPMLQFGLLLVAWYVSLSRVSDYKHHWSDVLAGGLIGSFVALVVLFYIRMWTKKVEKTPSDESGLVGVNGPLNT